MLKTLITEWETVLVHMFTNANFTLQMTIW